MYQQTNNKMRKNIEKDSYCSECGKYFNYLGFARHRAMHAEKRMKAKLEKIANDFNEMYPIGSTVLWKLPDDKVATIYTVEQKAEVVENLSVLFKAVEYRHRLTVGYVQHPLFI